MKKVGKAVSQFKNEFHVIMEFIRLSRSITSVVFKEIYANEH